MPKALVLGGKTGLLGQTLVAELKNKKWKTAALGREDGPVDDPAFLKDKIKNFNPDVIFNTIAFTQVDNAEEAPEKAREINRIFPDTLTKIIAEIPKAHLIHYSTDSVFSGQPPTDYWLETDEPQPLNVYARTKLEGEEAIRRNLPERAAILRCAWLFGPGRKNFVSTILDAAKNNSELTVVDDQRGCPTYTADLAGWSISLAEKRARGIWHTVNSGHATWCELAQEAVHLASIQCRVRPILSSEWPQKAARPNNAILGNNKLAAFLGYKPRPWLQALRDYVFLDYLNSGG